VTFIAACPLSRTTLICSYASTGTAHWQSLVLWLLAGSLVARVAVTCTTACPSLRTSYAHQHCFALHWHSLAIPVLWLLACRFPGGESGSDVYNRVSIFEDHLIRDMKAGRFSQSTSLCLVTHGLTMRVFLMRWFNWTVESFLQVCMQFGGGCSQYVIMLHGFCLQA
jgi:hypothetical protein